ncbi:MAG: nicotinate phosphoribosyltransferase [Actinobacteria bacterium]|nr:nicotinate phosphoribosyltransferase [Actinomycetota bacterium]
MGRALGLHTDAYELTMLDAALRSGVASERAVFEVFARSLPRGYRYGMVAGLARLVDAIHRFRFSDEHLEYLERIRLVSAAALEHLSTYRFAGDVDAYREGELFFPFSPVLTVTATFADAIVAETLVLSILNHDSAVASAASRMVDAARGRPLIEGGSRRTHEEAAVAAARAAYLAGFGSTSNLEAGRRYGIPTAGTAAHAFVLAYPSEVDAFSAQVESQGAGTTLLVDTYDVPQGIRNAVAVAGPGLGAIRIDSGDLLTEVAGARQLLDHLGAHETRIIVSGDLDEHTIAALAGSPVDAFMVGTRVVLAPTPGFVYKLVAMGDGAEHPGILRPVAKLSIGKATTACPKRAFRCLDDDGRAVAEHLLVDQNAASDGRPLQVRVVQDGEAVHSTSLAESRAHAEAARAELPDHVRDVSDGAPAMMATLV